MADDYSLSILAQLGDAVHHLLTIEDKMKFIKQSHELHKSVVNQVNATNQAKLLELLKPQLSPEELDLVRRARNCKSIKKVKIKQSIYRRATALEVLFGFLYLTDRNRLNYLHEFGQAQTHPDNCPALDT